jgi:ketosteroid isomerase-like protein
MVAWTRWLSSGTTGSTGEGRARLSGVTTELRYAIVYTLRDGKIVRGREYANRQEAFAAVGLAE